MSHIDYVKENQRLKKELKDTLELLHSYRHICYGKTPEELQALIEKEIPSGENNPYDPGCSITCLCGNDVVTEDNDYEYCFYCGQKLDRTVLGERL